jgi:multidrug efflux pump subunit AcrB
MMAEMRDTILLILAFALFFSFVVLAVQFNSLKLPAIILGCLPFCAAGMIYALYLMRIPVGATVLIGLLVVVATMVNGGVLLLVLAEELRVREGLTPFEAVRKAAEIRLRPRVMIAAAVIVGFIPLALNIEEGGDMLQPVAVGAIGGLSLGILVALLLMPCLYLIFSRRTEETERPSTV